MIGSWIYSTLSTLENLKRELGNKPNIFPLVVPQGQTLPAIVYRTSGSDPVDSTDGPAKVDYDTIRITCWVNLDDYDQGHQIMRIVRAKLDRFSGSAGGVNVEDIFLVDKAELADESGKAIGIMQTYRVRLDRDLDASHDVNQYDSDDYEIAKN